MNSNCCQASSSTNKKIKQIAKLLRVFTEENRLRILCLLQKENLCVCELLEKLNLPQNLTSHHLSVLKKTNLVADEKRGRRIYYSLTPKGERIIKPILKLTKEGGEKFG